MTNPDPPAVPGRRLPAGRATASRGSTALVAGSVGAGLAAYGFVVLGTRAFGSIAFSSVAQVWTIWFVGAAALTFPLQHWIIDTRTKDGDLVRVRRALPRIGAMVLVVALGMGAICTVFDERLFTSTSPLYPLAVTGVIFGSGLVGVFRGLLGGEGRFAALGAAMAGENLVRLALGSIVVAAGGTVELYGLTVASGMLVALAWPGVWPRGRSTPGPRPPLVEVLSGLGGGNLLAQFVLTGGPVVLAFIGGAPAQVTALFVVLSLIRAPYLVALGVSVRATATLSQQALSDRPAIEAHWRRLRWGVLVVGLVATSVAALIGPWGVRLVFGQDVAVTRGLAAAVALGSIVAVGNLLSSLLMLVDGRTTDVLVAWLVAVGVALVVLAVPIAPLQRVVAAFVVAEAVALATMSLRRGRPGALGGVPAT